MGLLRGSKCLDLRAKGTSTRTDLQAIQHSLALQQASDSQTTFPKFPNAANFPGRPNPARSLRARRPACPGRLAPGGPGGEEGAWRGKGKESCTACPGESTKPSQPPVSTLVCPCQVRPWIKDHEGEIR